MYKFMCGVISMCIRTYVCICKQHFLLVCTAHGEHEKSWSANSQEEGVLEGEGVYIEREVGERNSSSLPSTHFGVRFLL